MSLNSILVGLAGDVMIGRLVDEHLNSCEASFLWGNVLPLLKQNDLNIMNLEAALTVSSKEVPKVFNFKASPEKVQSLSQGLITLVNLANNHVLDYSTEGLLETLKTLKKASIGYVGAGKDQKEAQAPLLVKKKGITLGFIGMTDNEPTWAAGENSPGTYYIQVGESQVETEIAKLRKQVDLVVVTIHWGPNMRERPTAPFIKYAHRLIDNGADIVHGHSAHIFQGIEKYKNGLILYDTGDFVDDYAIDPILRNDHSFLFVIEVTKQGISQLRLYPTVIANFQVNLAEGQEAEEIMNRMIDLSKDFQTSLIKEKDHLLLEMQEKPVSS